MSTRLRPKPPRKSILNLKTDSLKALSQLGANSSWEHSEHQLGNILEVAAVHGGVEKMEILANSSLAPVEYEVTRLDILFRQFRDHTILRASGLACSAEEELAAFRNLIRKKGIAINMDVESPVAIAEDMVEQVHGNDDENVKDKEIDIYEDALEELSL